jgi:sugar fermentation stimulation protein A
LDIKYLEKFLALSHCAWSLSSMLFKSPLSRGTLIKRYKRFLADVVLDAGETITAACPNTGTMLGLTTPGLKVWLSQSDSATRKYPHTLEIVEREDIGLIGINTVHPNGLVEEALKANKIPEIAGYSSIRREVKYGENSRIDLLLEAEGRSPCYVEVKNVTLYRKPDLAEFPDCKTERGEKHLREMAAMVQQGCRAVMVYCIQGGHPNAFTLTPDLDRNYFNSFLTARKAGVEAMALTCHVSPDRIEITGAVPLLDLQ